MTSPEGPSGHVLVCGGVHPDGVEILEEAPGITYELIEDDSERLAARIADCEGVVMRICGMTEAMVEGAGRLKVVSRHGVGVDNIPVAALTARGIPVMVTGDANSESVAEHALFMLLSLLRKGSEMDRAVREGDWQARRRVRTSEAKGRRMLVVGFGRIGKLAAAKFAALGMEVSVHDPYVDASACEEHGVRHAEDLNAELGRADAVSLHMPSTGKEVIGEAELALMQEHALLVNVSRGDLVDEDALAKALKEGRLAGAGADVFGTEPPPSDHPLLGLGNTILSPHSAALTDDSLRAMGTVCVRNVLDALAGAPRPDCVFNREVIEGRA